MTSRLVAWIDSDRISPRAKGIVALVLSIPLAIGIQCAVLLWVPLDFLPFQWEFLAWCVISGVATVALVLLLLRSVRGRTGWRSTVSTWFGPKRVRDLAFGLALTLPLPVAMAFTHGLDVFALPDSDLLAFNFSSDFVSPIVEEVLFRGLLLGLLLREVRLNAWAAIVLTSFLFGAAHASYDEPLSFESIVDAFLRVPMGAFLGWAYWKRAEDLSLPIGFHAGNNIAATFLPNQGIKDLEWRTMTVWILQILTMALAYFVIRILEERRARAVPPPMASAQGHNADG